MRISFLCLLGGCVVRNAVLFGDIYCRLVCNDVCCMLSLCTCMHKNACMPSSMHRIRAHFFERHIYVHTHTHTQTNTHTRTHTYTSKYMFEYLYLCIVGVLLSHIQASSTGLLLGCTISKQYAPEAALIRFLKSKTYANCFLSPTSM
jgi:hypothetical protein